MCHLSLLLYCVRCTNYQVAGIMLESMSGLDYYALADEYLLAPLGLSSTTSAPLSTLQSFSAQQYLRNCSDTDRGYKATK